MGALLAFSSTSAEFSTANNFAYLHYDFWPEENYLLKNLKEPRIFTWESLWKFLMVPRPRKEFQKMNLGRSDNPQNAKLGMFSGAWTRSSTLTPGFFRTCKECSNRKSTKDAVPQLVLRLNSYVIIYWRNLVYLKFSVLKIFFIKVYIVL